MYQIKKLNKISGAVYDELAKAKYNVSEDIELADADAILVRSAKCHDMEIPEKLLAVARAGAGVNNIPIDKMTQKGVVVFNTPGANANAVKELVICALLVASRNVVEAAQWTNGLIGSEDMAKQVEKGKSAFKGPELKGKTFGVIGLGAIGVLVANAADALGMRVIGYDPYLSVNSALHLSRNIEIASKIDELLTAADYITVHVPLMDATKNYIDAPEFEKMKKGVIVLNFARDGIVNEKALLNALAEEKVAKYVTDFPDETLLKTKNVICTPHLGASTPESEENCAVMAAMELRDYIEKGSIKNSVNMPACELAAPAGYRLTLIHKNLPNMVGQMTAILAKEQINIEEMANKSRGDIAYTVFDLNREASEEAIKELSKIDGMIKIREI